MPRPSRVAIDHGLRADAACKTQHTKNDDAALERLVQGRICMGSIKRIYSIAFIRVRQMHV